MTGYLPITSFLEALEFPDQLFVIFGTVIDQNCAIVPVFSCNTRLYNFRFIHPGVTDKGNYNMFAPAKPPAPPKPTEEEEQKKKEEEKEKEKEKEKGEEDEEEKVV